MTKKLQKTKTRQKEFKYTKQIPDKIKSKGLDKAIKYMIKKAKKKEYKGWAIVVNGIKEGLEQVKSIINNNKVNMEDTSFENLPSAEQKRIILKFVDGVLGAIFALVILFGSFEIIGAGERGVVLRLGAVNRVMVEGLNFKIPLIESTHKISVKTQTITFDNESSLGAASKDLQDVSVSVIINYHQDYLKVGDVYKKYGSSYEENVIMPIIRETVKSTASQYTAEELVTKRVEVSDKIASLLTQKLLEKDSILEKFNIVNFSFSKSFNEAIEAKVTAEQNALAAKNKLEQVKYEAEQRVTQAKGEAEAIAIQAQAIQAQGGAEYVNLKAVEKWDGMLPTTMIPNSGLPFLNIK